MKEVVVTESGIEYSKSQIKSMFASQIISVKKCLKGPDKKKLESWIEEGNSHK